MCVSPNLDCRIVRNKGLFCFLAERTGDFLERELGWNTHPSTGCKEMKRHTDGLDLVILIKFDDLGCVMRSVTIHQQ